LDFTIRFSSGSTQFTGSKCFEVKKYGQTSGIKETQEISQQIPEIFGIFGIISEPETLESQSRALTTRI